MIAAQAMHSLYYPVALLAATPSATLLVAGDADVDVGRWFYDQAFLDDDAGQTYVLSNQWAKYGAAAGALADLPDAKVTFRQADARDEQVERCRRRPLEDRRPRRGQTYAAPGRPLCCPTRCTTSPMH